MEKQELLKVAEGKLDLTYYSGTDLYSDGDVEDELLEAVLTHDDIEEYLMTSDNWAHLYHLSPIREHILDWYEFDKNATVLEIGSGCGAITGLLCEKTRQVTCIDLSKKRSVINACKNAKYDNFQIVVGNFQDIELKEKFDYVTLIGVFEYSICYMGGDKPFEAMLEKVKKYLKPGGKLIIAIENKYGLKYFSGAREDHTGRFFDGLENYAATDRVRTFSRATLVNMLEKSGFESNEFYYPFPDYKLPDCIFSDSYLPTKGQLRYPTVSYDRDRYELFNERQVYDSLCEDGMFKEMANSFLIISEEVYEKSDNSCIYAKYNRMRAPQYRTRTRIMKNAEGELYVEKKALNKEAVSHIKNMEKNYRVLRDRLSLSLVDIMLNEAEDIAVFPYVKGKNLNNIIMSQYGDKQVFLNALDRALENVFPTGIGKKLFEKTEEFTEIFGEMTDEEYSLLKKMKCYPASNIDCIFSNYSEEAAGYVSFDYEWVTEFPVPVDFLQYRTIMNHVSENSAYINAFIGTDEIMKHFGITEEKKMLFDKMEDSFQQMVHGENRKYNYLTRYAKKVINIGANFQNDENWFRSVMDDLHECNTHPETFRENLIDCHIQVIHMTESQWAWNQRMKHPIKSAQKLCEKTKNKILKK